MHDQDNRLHELLSELHARAGDEVVRLFACECCEKASKLLADPIMSELIGFGRRRATGDWDEYSLVELRGRVNKHHHLFQGGCAPSVAALALSSAGEVAFTESSETAAINALGFAASAFAQHVAENEGQDDYDDVYEATYAKERMEQFQLLVEILKPFAQQ